MIFVIDDKKIISKSLKGIDKMDRIDQKLTLDKLKISMGSYKALSNAEILSLSEASRHFFQLLERFGKNENLTKFVNIWLLEDPIREKLQTADLFNFGFTKISFFAMKKAEYTNTKN